MDVLVLGDEPSYRTAGTSVVEGDKRLFSPYKAFRRVSVWECHDYFSIHAFLLVLSSSFLARRLFTSREPLSCRPRTRTTITRRRIAVAGGGGSLPLYRQYEGRCSGAKPVFDTRTRCCGAAVRLTRV